MSGQKYEQLSSIRLDSCSRANPCSWQAQGYEQKNMFSDLNLIFSLLSRITKDWVSRHCFLTSCRNSVILVLCSTLFLSTLQPFHTVLKHLASFPSVPIVPLSVASESYCPPCLPAPLTSQLLIVRFREDSADSWALVGQVWHPQSISDRCWNA